MKKDWLVIAGMALVVSLAPAMQGFAQGTVGSGKIKHVLLLSIDGMHAVDFRNCVHGVAAANGEEPYCPNMAALGQIGIN
jgi:hypothetical protein